MGVTLSHMHVGRAVHPGHNWTSGKMTSNSIRLTASVCVSAFHIRFAEYGNFGLAVCSSYL